jgi:polar amino acid transport system substrate-binding protein
MNGLRLTLLTLLAVTILGACGEVPAVTPDDIRARGELVVGTEAEFFPFEYATPSGEYGGFDMDLARMLAEELGVKLRVENMRFDGLIPALLAGKIDMILSGMTATPKRAETISFSEPYFETGLCLLLNRETTGDVTSVDDLNDAKWRIAVKLGTTGDKATQERLPKAKRTSFNKEADCAQEVATGRADAFVYDQLSVAKHHQENPETTRAILTPFTKEPYAAGFRQEDVELREFVSAFLRKIKGDGRYDALARKHFPAEMVEGSE